MNVPMPACFPGPRLHLSLTPAQHTAHSTQHTAHSTQLWHTLQEARASQASAEQRATNSLKAGAARKLKEAEARVEALEGVVAELRGELENQVCVCVCSMGGREGGGSRLNALMCMCVLEGAEIELRGSWKTRRVR